MERPAGLKIIIVLFLIISIYNVYLFINPFEINNSLTLGRLWALLWFFLDGALVCGLILYARWTTWVITVSYALSLVSALFSGSITGLIFIGLFWTAIYLPCIKYLKKENIKSLYLKSPT
jgi:hypothetical protein